MEYNIRSYLYPWKLLTLVIGIGLLIFGSFYYKAPDWDIPISFIMAILTYFLAPWTMYVIMEKKLKLIPAAVFATWFTVDGSYTIYWYFVDPVALEMMRLANFPASLALYMVCGVIWLYQGTLREGYKQAFS